MARKPDSKAVAEARVELAAIAADLKGIKVRAQAIERRLRVAARAAEIAGVLDGAPWTEEAWLADHVKTVVEDDFAGLVTALRALAHGKKWTTVAGEVAVRQAREARWRAGREALFNQPQG